MPDLPSVSVMFVTRGRPELIRRALAAVLEDDATSEAIVVIDGEDPETSEVLDLMASEETRIKVGRTPPPGPEGLDSTQRGRDHGAALASSEVVLALDDDVIARPGLVSGHARHHAGDDGRLMVVGYMPVATRPRWPWSYAPIRFYSEAYEQHCDRYAVDPGYILKHLWGGNTSLRRGDWLAAVAAGRVPCYHEDKEFGLLLARRGYRAAFDRTLRADHWYERNLRGFVARAERTVPAQDQLRSAYADVIEDKAWVDLPQRRSLALLLLLARSRAGWLAVKWGLLGATTMASAMRLRRVEGRLASILWRVASERAAGTASTPAGR
jgi:GT2 family glycosyltransferase